MKFLIAPDSFKESMSAIQACSAIAKGIHSELPDAETLLLPLADGGEGSLSVLVSAMEGELLQLGVSGPLFTPVEAHVGLLGDETAIIEIAEAAGLHLIPPDERNPELTSSQGVGELISKLLDRGIRRFLIALGGSGTNDGGLGMLTALGAVPLDKYGAPLHPTGQNLIKVVRLELSGLDSRVNESHFMLACDVDNPLTGERGASAVFAPQKGASAKQVTQLDKGLENWSEILNETFGRQVKDIPGSGAAGGLAAAFLAAFDSTISSGIEQILDVVGFDQKCAGVDWVITGEGCLDGQSLAGKTPVGVARRAKEYRLPVVAFAGRLGDNFEALYEAGVDLALPITPEGMPLAEALSKGEENLTQATRALMKLLFANDQDTETDSAAE